MERQNKVLEYDDPKEIERLKSKTYSELKDNDKVFISVNLLGGSKYTEKEIGLDHVEDTLKRFDLTYIEAIGVIKDSEGSRSPDTNEIKGKKVVEYLERLKEIEGADIKKPYLKKNKHPEIFTQKGYNLFLKLHDYYKDSNTKQADYSYVFIAMKRDEYILSTGADFIKFISTIEVDIDKIDARQNGKNKRDSFYKSAIAQQ